MSKMVEAIKCEYGQDLVALEPPQQSTRQMGRCLVVWFVQQ